MKKLIIFTLLLFVAGCNGSEFLANLSQNEVNEAIYLLEGSNIKATKRANKKKTGYSLILNSDDFSRAVQILKEYGYPKEKNTSLQELFKKEGLVSSPLEDKVRYIYGLELGIQDTLSQIDDVISAKVHIVLPDNDPFQEEVEPSSASVFIKHRPGSDLRQYKSRVKRLVEKSIAGLSYDQVSLILMPASPIKTPAGLSLHKQNENNIFHIVIVFLTLLLIASWLSFFFKEETSKLKQKVLIKFPALNKSIPTKEGNSSDKNVDLP